MHRDPTPLAIAQRLRFCDGDPRTPDQQRDDGFRPAEPRSFASVNNQLYPSLALRETDEAYEIAVDMPGLERPDVKVGLRDNVLTIRGERRGAAGPAPCAEVVYGRFERVIPLAVAVDPRRAEARLANGRFEVRLPKRLARA